MRLHIRGIPKDLTDRARIVAKETRSTMGVVVGLCLTIALDQARQQLLPEPSDPYDLHDQLFESLVAEFGPPFVEAGKKMRSADCGGTGENGDHQIDRAMSSAVGSSTESD